MLAKAQALMEEAIEEPLSIDALSARCGVSKRELQYLFRKYLKASPKAYYLTFRLQRAKELLLYSDMSIGETEIASGFFSRAAYFQAFGNRFKTSPLFYRATFRQDVAIPDGRRVY